MSSPPSARIIEGPALRVVGLQGRFQPGQNDGISKMWQKMVVRDEESYGVCYDYHDNSFEYLSSVVAKPDRTYPSDWHTFDIPKATYAVFDHTGPIWEIHDTWRHIHTWTSPEWELVMNGTSFEKYSKEFCPNVPGGVEIWLPVQRKGQ